MIVSEVWIRSASAGSSMPGHLGEQRTRTGRDHEPVGADLLVADLQHLGRDEPAPARGRGPRWRCRRRYASPPADDRVDAAEDAVAHLIPADVDLRPTSDPEAAAVPRGLGEVGRVGEHLRRDAADVQAGAAEPLLPVDEGDLPVREPLVDDRVAAAGADDAQVEVPHAPIVPRPVRAGVRRPPPTTKSRAANSPRMPEYECRPETSRLMPTKLNQKLARPTMATIAARRPFQPTVTRACR